MQALALGVLEDQLALDPRLERALVLDLRRAVLVHRDVALAGRIKVGEALGSKAVQVKHALFGEEGFHDPFSRFHKDGECA